MRIALFVTCLADTLFPEAGRATVRLLERLGHQVEFPAAQTCCGQMHVNTGYLRDALPLVRRYVEVFEDCEAIVVPSGSCTGSIRHQHAMVARRYGDEALARRAEAVASRTYELSELLVDVLGVEDVGAYYPHRVTYHPTCHSLRLLRVGDRPLRLLRHVAGIDLVELPDADTCCGFGGTFAACSAGRPGRSWPAPRGCWPLRPIMRCCPRWMRPGSPGMCCRRIRTCGRARTPPPAPPGG